MRGSGHNPAADGSDSPIFRNATFHPAFFHSAIFPPAFLAGLISIAAFLHFFRAGEVLLYGDALAHMNIARRVLDSRSPGLLQLGTVWLPLPHLLAMPFLISDWAWRTGVGGAIPSMMAYVVAVAGIFRLVRFGLERVSGNASHARVGAWVAAGVFAANPNLIYLQSTAMTEALSLAAFLWAVVYFGEFTDAMLAGRGDGCDGKRALLRSGWCLAALMLTRYDGWFAAAGFVVAAYLVYRKAGRGVRPENHAIPGVGRKTGLLHFVLIVAAVPVFWLAYNALSYGNPLEFANGEYSARAIEERTRRPGDPHHPGWNDPVVAAQYFVKSAKLNLGEWTPAGGTFFPLAVAGSALVLLLARRISCWLLLWLPMVTYPSSVAWGGVPIFIPPWWPYSYYNVRYGIQLLPAIAVFTAALVYFSLELIRARIWRVAVPAAVLSLVAACYASAWAISPVSLREGRVNSSSKLILERALAGQLRGLPQGSTFLMYVGQHGGALQFAGIPLHRTLNEGDRKLWPHAMEAPAEVADYVVATAEDPVARALGSKPRDLDKIVVIVAPGQEPVAIYRSRKRGSD